MATIESSDVPLIEYPHGVGQAVQSLGCREQMDMIAQHYERMHVDAMRLGDIGEQGSVEPVVIGVDEGRASIDATLRDMRGTPGRSRRGRRGIMGSRS
jgi:hypothetical protein